MAKTKIDLTQIEIPKKAAPAPAKKEEKSPPAQPAKTDAFKGLLAKLRKRPVFGFGFAGIVLLGGLFGAAAYLGWIPGLGKNQKPEASSANRPPSEIGQAFKMNPLVINLKGSGNHYVKTTLVLEFDKKWAQEVEKRVPPLTDTAILVLCEKALEDMRKPDSRENLKKELLEKMNQVMGAPKIHRLYFEEFLFQ